MDSVLKSLLKALSYRLLGSSATTLIAYLLVGNAGVAVGIGVADSVVKIALFFLHERIWERIFRDRMWERISGRLWWGWRSNLLRQWRLGQNGFDPGLEEGL